MQKQLLSFIFTLLAAGASAAQHTPGAHEVWSGTYRCGPMASSDGYSASIRMVVDDGAARIHKQTAQITETLSGRVAADGTLTLEGTGQRKGGAFWRYRFDGRFEGERFTARGAMLSANLGTTLRDCSISLRRVQAAAAAPRAEGQRTEAAAPPSPALQQAPAVAESGPETAATPKPQAEPREEAEDKSTPGAIAEALIPVETDGRTLLPNAPGSSNALEREIDLHDGHDAAWMEGTVERGVPHRFVLNARRGQLLSATLTSDGARLDLYEPGSSITLLSGGFVVQGARLGATEDGSRLRVELPADGRYLLVVRALDEKAFYTLELAADSGTWYSAGRWRRYKWVWITLLVGAAALAVGFLIRRRRERWLFRSG